MVKEMDPKSINSDKMEFRREFSWSAGVLNADQERQLEDFVADFCDVFAKHRSNKGCNTELNFRLTPENALLVYVQGPPAPIHLCEELLIELLISQDVIFPTTLSDFNNSSPITVLCKSPC